jgi:hypothetical protein
MALDMAGSHTASKTWVSAQAKERDAFTRFRNNCAHVAPSSPFIPNSWTDWVRHRLWAKEEAHRKAAYRLAAKERSIPSSKASMPVFNGRTFEDLRSPVLAMESTTWLPASHLPPEWPQAPWPTNGELKNDGPYRSVSGLCRFLPLPRAPRSP